MVNANDHVDDEELQKQYQDPGNKAIKQLNPTKLTNGSAFLVWSSISQALLQESGPSERRTRDYDIRLPFETRRSNFGMGLQSMTNRLDTLLSTCKLKPV